MTSRSEVAQLLEQIEAEYVAGQRALHSPAMIGGHEMITKHTENIGRLNEQLGQIVGEMSAIKMVAEALDQVVVTANGNEF